MVVDRKHLRKISSNAVGTSAAGVLTAIGPAVPANKTRTIYFVKLTNPNATPETALIFSDGIGGAAAKDAQQIPGSGNPIISSTGKAFIILGKDIETPVYTLTEGQQIGLDALGGATLHMFFTFYDEE